jgi:hypothetical protein
VRCQTSREADLLVSLTVRHSSRRSQALYRSLQGIRLVEISVACEEVREGESASSPGVQWATGVGANGGARRGHAKPRHAPSRDRRSRVRQPITRGVHSCIPCGSKAALIKWSTEQLLYSADNPPLPSVGLPTGRRTRTPPIGRPANSGNF